MAGTALAGAAGAAIWTISATDGTPWALRMKSR
jgi:hypothetical protein